MCFREDEIVDALGGRLAAFVGCPTVYPLPELRWVTEGLSLRLPSGRDRKAPCECGFTRWRKRTIRAAFSSVTQPISSNKARKARPRLPKKCDPIERSR